VGQSDEGFERGPVGRSGDRVERCLSHRRRHDGAAYRSPTLTRELGASASEKLWIINAYSLVVAGLLPGCGTLGDKIGHKRMLVIGLCLFGLASLAAAYSPSPVTLIGARALLAVGAASMMPATLSIIRLTFSEEKESSLAIGIWSAIASGGSAIGPLIGGILL
jgi:DHA2 family multidrug resistance protein-like MFS transporter